MRKYIWLTICADCGGVVEERSEPYRDCYGEPLPSQCLYYPDVGDTLEGCGCEPEKEVGMMYCFARHFYVVDEVEDFGYHKGGYTASVYEYRNRKLTEVGNTITLETINDAVLSAHKLILNL